MNKKHKLLLTALALVGVSGCQQADMEEHAFKKAVSETFILEKSLNTESRNEYHRALPDVSSLNLDEEKVDLGNMLYHDTRLSGDGTLSCASCHNISQGGDDNSAVSTGIDGQKGPINSPTSLNSGFNFKQFWDGRAEHLRAQAEGPVENPIEMGAKWPDVVAKIQNSEGYQKLFEDIYPHQGINKYTITDAIAEFERSLITPAPIDSYLKGNDSALTQSQVKGYKLFKSYGCVSCHQGVNFGGNMMQKFGAIQAYFNEKNETAVDYGLFAITKNEVDKNVFKVPSLRNIEMTSPYFHNAGAKTLEDAVKIMGLNQLGVEIPKEDIDSIADFLTSLTGEMNVKPLSPPAK